MEPDMNLPRRPVHYGLASLWLAIAGCQQPATEATPETVSDIDVSEEMTITPALPPGSLPDSIDDFSGEMPTKPREAKHAHGHASLRIHIAADRLSVMFDSPLASLGLAEGTSDTAPTDNAINSLQDQFVAEERIVQLPEKAECELVSVSSGTRLEGDHSALMVEQDFTCKRIKRVKSTTIRLFEAFSDLKQINTTFHHKDMRRTVSLTPDTSELDLKR